MADMEVPVSEVAPCPDPGRQYSQWYVGWVDGQWQVRDCGGSYWVTTMEAGSGVV